MQLLRSTTLESARFNHTKVAVARAGAILTIDLAAIAENYQLLREQARTAVCAAVVKADAYGLGTEAVAPVLARAGFRQVAIGLPRYRMSLAASSGIFLGSDYHFDFVRPGAALYGIAAHPGSPNPMRPVVRLQGKVMQIRDVPANSPVGYGHTARASAPARLATVAVGYADGFLRSLPGRGAAWFNGSRLPIVGRVSMDSIILDATVLPDGSLPPGALVDLIGPVTSLGTRYHRQYIHS